MSNSHLSNEATARLLSPVPVAEATKYGTFPSQGTPGSKVYTSPSLGIPSIKLSLVLQNNGSVARDHLASERTLLAYFRTSLAISAAGVAFVQLMLLSNHHTTLHVHALARPLGATMVLFGMIVMIIGGYRFFVVQDVLIAGYILPARTAVLFISSAQAALILTAAFIALSL